MNTVFSVDAGRVQYKLVEYLIFYQIVFKIELLQNFSREMLLLRHIEKWTYYVLILLSIWSPFEVHAVGHLRQENKICTSTDQWAVGLVLSRSHIEQSVRNLTDAGQGINSKYVELKKEHDEEMRVLGQGRAFDTLIHTKETHLNLADTCLDELHGVQQTTVETFHILFPKFVKRALSPDTWAGLGIGTA